MAKLIDLTGNKYNKLTIVERRGSDKNGHPLWLCKCDCGNYKIYRGDKVKTGKIKSCGCLIGQHHGLCNTRLYKIFDGMKERCYNKNKSNYKYYGARGIQICDEWLTDFIKFYVWATENGYKENLTIDRIDPNGNYEPDNCRWVTKLEQANNKRNNVHITYNGKTQTISQWCNELGLKNRIVYDRKHKGWSDKECLFGRDNCHAKKSN